MFAAGDVNGLLAMLGKGDYRSKAAAANYLAQIGDLGVLEVLEKLSAEYRDELSNPFLSAIKELMLKLRNIHLVTGNPIKSVIGPYPDFTVVISTD